MKTLKPVAIYLSLALLSPLVPAYAQVGATDLNAGPYAQWRPGREQPIENDEGTGLLDNFKLRPYLGVSYARDDNVFWVEDGGNRQTDDILTVAPGIILRYARQEKHSIELDYSHEWHWYDEFKEEDYEADRLSLRLRTGTAKTFFILGDTYSETRREDNASQSRLDEERNIAYGNIKHILSEKTALGLRGFYQTVHFRESEPMYVDPIDYDEAQIGGRLYYRITAKTDIFAEYAVGQVKLDDDDVPGDYGDADYQQVSVGINGQVTEKTTTYGSVGYQHRTFEGDIDDVDRWTAGIGAQSAFTQRLRGGCDLVAGITPSVTTAGHSVTTTRVSPYLSRDFIYDYFTATISGAYERARYYTEDGRRDESDDYWEAGALLDWHPLKQMTIGVGYVHQVSRGNDTREEITRDSISLRLGASI